MGVYQRGGVWWCKFNVAGQRHQISLGLKVEFTSEREAKAAERVERVKLETEGPRLKARAYTVAEACALWFAEHGASLDTADQVNGYLKNLCRYLGPATPLADVGGAEVKMAMAKRAGEPAGGNARKVLKAVSAATVNRQVPDLLRRVMFYMRDVHEAPVKPIAWKKLRQDEGVSKGRELKAGDHEAGMWAALRDDYADLTEFALVTGWRTGQCLLRWSQYDAAAGTAERLVQKRRKGQGGASHETVSLPARAIALIEAQRGNDPEWIWTYRVQVRASRDQSATGWMAGDQLAPITDAGWRQVWRRGGVAKATGGMRRHDLRHTAGTRVNKAGGIKNASLALGHSDIGITSRTYAHATPAEVVAALDAAAATYNRPGAPAVAGVATESDMATEMATLRRKA